MAINTAGVAAVSEQEILFNEVQEVLKNNAVFLPNIMDYTMKVGPKAKGFDIPRLSGGAAVDRKEDGTEHSDGDMAIAVDTCTFDQNKIVPQYIYDLARMRTELDLDEAFLELAPTSLADLIEQAIYAQLKLASTSAPDHLLQLSGAGNIVPTLADFFTAAQVLDEAKVPVTDRYISMDPLMYHSVMQISEVLDASKSGTQSSIIQGQFSEIAGFKLLKTNNNTANEMLCWHKSALAFGLKREVAFEKERQASKERDFLALKASYGSKVLDGGVRCVLFNSTGI
jgi:hypothetical protein